MTLTRPTTAEELGAEATELDVALFNQAVEAEMEQDAAISESEARELIWNFGDCAPAIMAALGLSEYPAEPE